MKNGVTTLVNMKVKTIVYAKNIIVVILAHVFVRITSI